MVNRPSGPPSWTSGLEGWRALCWNAMLELGLGSTMIALGLLVGFSGFQLGR
jgi:hypothetical protein